MYNVFVLSVVSNNIIITRTNSARRSAAPVSFPPNNPWETLPLQPHRRKNNEKSCSYNFAVKKPTNEVSLYRYNICILNNSFSCVTSVGIQNSGQVNHRKMFTFGISMLNNSGACATIASNYRKSYFDGHIGFEHFVAGQRIELRPPCEPTKYFHSTHESNMIRVP